MMKRCVVFLCLLGVIAVGLYAEEASAQEYSNQPGYKEARELMNDRYRFYMQQWGVSPSKAKKAIWAVSHKPESRCAAFTYDIMANLDEKPGRSAQAAMMSIENSDICEPRNLDKYTSKPAPLPPYDRNKDPRYLAKIFFRDHEQEARRILADAGIAPQAIDNVVQLFAENPKFHRATYQISSCAEDAMNIVFKGIGDPDYRGYFIDSDIAEMQDPRMCDDPDPDYMH